MNTLITLKQSGNFENASQHLKALATQNEEIQLTRYKPALPINALQLQNPMDNFPELETSVAILEREQQNDALLSKVTTWLTEGTEPLHNIYSSGEEQKYRKQLPRLTIDNGILKRNYYDHDGTILHKQVCVPKHMLKEILYRIHNSLTGGYLGITRTIAEFRRRFYCPNYIEQIASYIRNCSTCLQLKLVQPSRLKPPLSELSSKTSFPGDIMQIDIQGAFPSSPYKYVLTAIDVFSKYLFAVPLTTISAPSVAAALASIMFNHSFIPKEI